MTNYKLQRGPCSHNYTFKGTNITIKEPKSMWDCVIQAEWLMLDDLRTGGEAAALRWSDFMLTHVYDWFMRCIANDASTGVNLMWIEKHGGDEPPTQEQFIDAVRQRPDKSALDKIRGW